MRSTLALVAALLAVSTGASAQQTVHVDASVESIEVPDELPGTYDVSFSIETDPQAPTCACRSTTVYVGVEDASPLEVWRLQPTTYAIPWDQRMQDQEFGEHVERGRLRVHAAESLEAGEDRSLTITVGASHHGPSDGLAVETAADPARVQLPLPSQGETEAIEGNLDEANGQAGDEGERWQPSRRTNALEDTESVPAAGGVPAALALGLVACLLVAWRTRRR